MGAMIIKALGNDVFWVKFFPALFGAFTIYFAWKIVQALGGNLFAKNPGGNFAAGLCIIET
jgi:hypothetical protein